ncbi:STT3 domain-containing protein [Nanoarchaeota archaeon]
MAGKKKSKDEEISIDLGSIKSFFKGMKIDYKVLIIVALVLIPLIMSTHFRVQSAYLPVTDDWAASTVHNNIKSTLAAEVNKAYPNLPAQQKQELIDQQFQRVMEEQGDQIQQQIDGTSAHFKTRFQDENDQTYLLAIDPWMYFRWFRNWATTGNLYDEIRDGEPWNNHRTAPLGEPMNLNFHVLAGYILFRIVNLFNSGLPLMTLFFYIPVIFSALSVIPAYFIARRKGGDLAGFAAATLLAVHSSFLGRTSAGFSDTDAYNVFFPLMITWFFIEAFETDDMKKKLSLSALAGITTGLYSYAWSGWWYIFDFLVIVIIGYLAYVILKQLLVNKSDLKKTIKDKSVINTLIVGGLFILTSGIVVSFFVGPANFMGAPMQPLSFRLIKNAAHPTLWPNVYTTVAELGNTSLNTIMRSMGGKLLYFLALLGLGLTMISGKIDKQDFAILGTAIIVYLLLISDNMLGMTPVKYLALMALPLMVAFILTLFGKHEVDMKYALFLTIWFMGTIYASTKGIRFLLLLVPAFAVSFGIALGLIQRYLSKWITNELDLKEKWVGPVITILLLFLLVAPIQAAGGVGKNEVPSMNDAWWESLQEIRVQSEPDAIINSWWDFGHWFKAVADRGVTFDGAGQNSPMAHWIGKVLLSDDEAVALGILRMLDCGSYTGFDVLNEKIDDPIKTVNLLNEMMIVDKADARQILVAEGHSSIADELLELTHCEPPENYFITSEDMVGKAGVWAHFGSWNFERAYIYTTLRNKEEPEAVADLVTNYGFTEQNARDLYFQAQGLKDENSANAWISPWPNFVTGRWVGGCRNQTDIVQCSLQVQLSTQNNQRVILDLITVNLSDVASSEIRFSIYDEQSGAKLGETLGVPASIAIAGENLTTYKMENQSFAYDILLDTEQNRVMVMHPLFTEALFTKLFYLDGRYTSHFNKFSDKQAVNGQRIIVWKVDWDGQEE